MSPPDLNSLPPSRTMATSSAQPRSMHTAISAPERRDSPSPRLASSSLAATASFSAADLSRRSSASNRGSPRQSRASERRRSQVAMNLRLDDPTLPSPGELSSSDRRASQSYSSMSPFHPRRQRHNCNRRPTSSAPTQPGRHPQRTRTRARSTGQSHATNDPRPTTTIRLHACQPRRTFSTFLTTKPNHPQQSQSQHRRHPRRCHSRVRTLSQLPIRPPRHPSRRRQHHHSSPNIPQPLVCKSLTRSPPLPGHESSISSSIDWPPSPIEHARRNSLRDESQYYQAETANLTRENQMLRMRIRELEKQVNDLNAVPANTPSTPSNLMTSPPLEAEEEASMAAAIASSSGVVDKA